MPKIAGTALALVSGAAAAVLLVWIPTATYRDETLPCNPLIVYGEVGSAGEGDAYSGGGKVVVRHLQMQCDASRTRAKIGVAGLGIICGASWSGVVFAGRRAAAPQEKKEPAR